MGAAAGSAEEHATQGCARGGNGTPPTRPCLAMTGNGVRSKRGEAVCAKHRKAVSLHAEKREERRRRLFARERGESCINITTPTAKRDHIRLSTGSSAEIIRCFLLACTHIRALLAWAAHEQPHHQRKTLSKQVQQEMALFFFFFAKR